MAKHDLARGCRSGNAAALPLPLLNASAGAMSPRFPKSKQAALPSGAARAIPATFVLIWASGFVAARFIAPHAEPLAFVATRLVLTVMAFVAIGLALGSRWPSDRKAWGDALVAGVLMQGIYVAGVFWSVNRGLPAGIAALVGSLQPLLTAAMAGPLLGERVSRRR